jgi:L-iditol 2-dehydrogenase
VVGWAAGMDGLSEFVLTDGEQVATIDAHLDATTAILLQPLACVLSAVDQIRDITGASVAVIGQGSIGVLFSHVLKSRGARHVAGVDVVSREDVALKFGVDHAIHATSGRWAMQLSEDERPSIVVEAVGHQTSTLGDALEAVAFGGQIYYFGIPEYSPYSFDLWKFLRKNITMIAGTTRRRRHYLEVAGEYLRAHPELGEGYVSHIHDISDIQVAFECASVPAAGRLKVAIRMS